jgi:hypothetical protein
MAAVTYYVALAFKKAEDDGGDNVACDPREARNSEQAIRMAASYGGRTLRSRSVLSHWRSVVWRCRIADCLAVPWVINPYVHVLQSQQ